MVLDKYSGLKHELLTCIDSASCVNGLYRILGTMGQEWIVNEKQIAAGVILAFS